MALQESGNPLTGFAPKRQSILRGIGVTGDSHDRYNYSRYDHADDQFSPFREVDRGDFAEAGGFDAERCVGIFPILADKGRQRRQ